MDNIIFSALESNRFSLNIYRGKMEDIHSEYISDLIVRNAIDILIFRVESGKLEQSNELDKLGFPYIIADTLVYYSCDLENININSIKNQNLIFHKCNLSNSGDIENLVNVIFPNYTNHYNSNIYLDKSKILEGYVEWAINYIDTENRIAFIIENEKGYVGFITLSFDIEEAECEIILNGVLPNESGKGIYSDMVRFVQNYFKEQGFKKLLISTQIQNLAVQKVWAREGFVLMQSYNTIHVNSLLSKEFESEEMKKDVFQLVLNQNLFPSKSIVISQILSISLDNYFEMKFENPIILHKTELFIQEIDLKNDCKVICSKLSIDKLAEQYLVISKLYSNKTQLCAISYNYLLTNK